MWIAINAKERALDSQTGQLEAENNRLKKIADLAFDFFFAKSNTDFVSFCGDSVESVLERLKKSLSEYDSGDA